MIASEPSVPAGKPAAPFFTRPSRTLHYLLPWFLDQTNCDPGLAIGSVRIGGRFVPVRTETVLETPFCRLLHFERDGALLGPALLVAAPLSGHFAALLRDMLMALIPHYDLYVMSWLDARNVPAGAGEFGLEDEIDHMMTCLRAIPERVNLIGLCQSAMPALAATALLAADGERTPQTLTLFGGILDARIRPTRVARLAASRSLSWLENNLIDEVPSPYRGEGRLVYPAAVQQTALMAYLTRHLSGGGELFNKVMRDDGDDAFLHPFLRSFLSIMDIPARFFLDTIRLTFQQFALPCGQLTWRGRAVDPAAIADTALMTVEGELDDVSSPGQTKVAHDLCRNIPMDRQRHYLQRGSGHFGLMHGGMWRSQILPRVSGFIREMR